MKHEKQLSMECALASSCMALGYDYRTVSRAFHEHYGFMFGDSAGRRRARRIEWLHLADEFLTKLWGERQKWFLGRQGDFLPLANQRVSLAGQGVVSVTTGVRRHTMAFSKRRVYDPQEDFVVRLSTWLRVNPRHQVYDVTRVEKNNSESLQLFGSGGICIGRKGSE